MCFLVIFGAFEFFVCPLPIILDMLIYLIILFSSQNLYSSIFFFRVSESIVVDNLVCSTNILNLETFIDSQFFNTLQASSLLVEQTFSGLVLLANFGLNFFNRFFITFIDLTSRDFIHLYGTLSYSSEIISFVSNVTLEIPSDFCIILYL